MHQLLGIILLGSIAVMFGILLLIGNQSSGHRYLTSLDFLGSELKRHQVTSNFGIRTANQIRLVQWKREPWDTTDSSRIFMVLKLVKKEKGCLLSARQSCTLESTAKHNPDRTIQLWVERESSAEDELSKKVTEELSQNLSLCAALQHYSNIEIVVFDGNDYFANTSFSNWYESGDWRQSPHQSAHFSDYTSFLSLFRSGGLFVDLDTAVNIKPLTGPKWRNFLVKSERPDSNQPTVKSYQHITSGKIMHLVYGHSLTYELFANLAKGAYRPHLPSHEPSIAAIDTTLSEFCDIQSEDDIGRCLDVRLVDHPDVYLPKFNSYFWQQVMSTLNQSKTSCSCKSDEEKAQEIVQNGIASHGASFADWDSMAPHQQQLEEPLYSTLYSVLLTQHCPFTVLQFRKNQNNSNYH